MYIENARASRARNKNFQPHLHTLISLAAQLIGEGFCKAFWVAFGTEEGIAAKPEWQLSDSRQHNWIFQPTLSKGV